MVNIILSEIDRLKDLSDNALYAFEVGKLRKLAKELRRLQDECTGDRD